jgi:hypothetical protein
MNRWTIVNAEVSWFDLVDLEMEEGAFTVE